MKPFTKVEVTILEAGERPLGVKVWNDCCWVGDEWLGRGVGPGRDRQFGRHIYRLVGVRWPGASLLDLAERPWWDWFQVDQDTPEQAVAEVERDQGDQLNREFPR